MREFTAVFRKSGDWWIGWAEDVPGANAQERTLEEARQSLREAVRDILEETGELGSDASLGDVIRETLSISAA